MAKALTLPAWEVSPLPGPRKPLDHETEEGMKSEDPHVYYFHPAGSFLKVPIPAGAGGTRELCVSVMQFIVLRLIAATSGLGFLFYIII